MGTNLAKLLEPGRIGGIELKNRTVMAPMGVDYANPDGHVSKRQIDYYAERAGGGVGLVIVEAASVQPSLGKSFQQIHVDDDKYIPTLSRLADAIREGGACPAIQLHHGGIAAYRSLTGATPAAPSSLLRRGYEKPRELTIEDIKEIIDRFSRSADLCRKAGFKAVELHAGHQYIFAQFLSPLFNERTDEYGGSLENRARFLIEVVQAIKKRVAEMPVICRVNAEEYGTKEYAGIEKGITLDETLRVVKMLEDCGADAIHVTRTGWGPFLTMAMPYGIGEMLPLVEAVKRAVSIPVIAVGSFTAEAGEQALKEGKADFIAFGRGLLADPLLISKAAVSNREDIMPCIACFNCQSEYVSTKPEDVGVRCSVNARLGKESLYTSPIPKASARKKIVIIGGGPGGMEAARVSGLRGHDVVLFDKEAELGGQLQVAAVPPHKTRIADYTRYMAGQMKRLGVDLRLGVAVNEDMIQQETPDAVFVATGLLPFVPDIPGLKETGINFAADVLAGKCQAGENIVIIGGSLVGCETADFLTEQDRNRKVSIIEVLPRIGAKILLMIRPSLLFRLRSKGVQLLAGATCKEIAAGDAVVITKEGETERIPADTVLIAAGGRSNKEIYDVLKGKIPEIHLIGDAVEPRRIVNAVQEAFDKAYRI
ncbi:FAD-dependent oxidoreductase [Thermodesulfobacteriota bacterium]